MTSATTQSARGTGGRRLEGHGPFWSLTIIAMDVVAIYGLCAYGSRANLQAA
jgi:hypothetical protein